jgi:hypothetical protein
MLKSTFGMSWFATSGIATGAMPTTMSTKAAILALKEDTRADFLALVLFTYGMMGRVVSLNQEEDYDFDKSSLFDGLQII